MFPVGELLDSSLQGVLGVPFQITLNISGETLSQYLGTMLQVFLQPPVQHEHLVIRSAERHQGDANNQRDDESSAEQSHDASSETHNSAGVLPQGKHREHATLLCDSDYWPGRKPSETLWLRREDGVRDEGKRRGRIPEPTRGRKPARPSLCRPSN